VDGYTVTLNDGPNLYMLYKDVFVNRIYHFESQRPNPRILDCGSNIGMSILYFKRVYPAARIIGFEPDPAILPYLTENIERNKVSDVQIVQAAVSGKEGTLTFYSDAKYGSALADHMPNPPAGWARYDVKTLPLKEYLSEPVDFLKMNIEGAEWDALAACDGLLRNVRELIIEYHHLPGLPRTLHKILDLLDRQGFEYLINDFDSQTNGGVQPPFHLDSSTSYFLLVYARAKS
jgi:FkbM family methyltransferase